MTTTSVLAYSTSTTRGTTYAAPEYLAPEPVAADPFEDFEYCYVCGRCTNHVGEHEELVAAGLARYEHFTVIRTAAWDADRARVVADAGFTAYLAGPAAYEAFCQALEEATTA